MAGKKLTPQVPGEAQVAAEPTEEIIEAQVAAADDGGLPDADDIDPKTISQPILCRQGWVCPA